MSRPRQTKGASDDLFKHTFGPMVAICTSLADNPERAAALEQDFLDFVARSSRGTPEGPVEIPYEYLLIVARKRQ